MPRRLRHSFQNHSQWRIHDTTHIRIYGWRTSPRGACAGHGWQILWDDIWRRSQQECGHSIQHNRWRHADDTAQFLLAGRKLLGRRRSGRRTYSGYRWQSLWNNVLRWGSRLWHDFQDYPQWYADDTIQYLLTGWLELHGRLPAVRHFGPGHRRGPLRDNGIWRRD